MNQVNKESNQKDCVIQMRMATVEDVSLILYFIKALADYEGMLDQVTATEEGLKASLFDRRGAEVVIAAYGGKPVGFALFFHNFSTFLGKSGLYLEDLYVEPEARGLGIGKALLQYLAQLAEARGCGRMEWWCLDWNKPSIAFYQQLGAEAMSDWTVYRLKDDSIRRLAGGRDEH